MLPIVFCEFPKKQQPGSGELWIRPAQKEDRDRRAMALLVLEKGVEVLDRGSGEVSCIVVDASGIQPTFDEMLAAWFAQRLLDGQPLPKGLRSIAKYAQLTKQGFTLKSLPPEQNLDGIYQAIRNIPGVDLTKPEIGSAFLTGWQRLTERILWAVETETDVFNQSLFASGSDFAEEQAYLRHDRDVYRQDVERGERWKVRLSGGPPLASGLLLRDPKSLLFYQWCRRDRETPTGQPYQFLAVDWGEGGWVFSTDPVQKLSLKPLAERLQQAEVVRNPEAVDDPWYDGRDHQYSLVAPPKGGTKLANDEVLCIVRAWMKPPRDFRPLPWRTIGSTAALVLLAGLCLLIWLLWPKSLESKLQVVKRDHVLKQILVDGKSIPLPRGIDDIPKDLVFGTSMNVVLKPGYSNVVLSEENRFSEERPIHLQMTLHSIAPRFVRMQLNDKPLKPENHVRKQHGDVETNWIDASLKGGRNRIEVRLHNPSKEAIETVLEMNWSDDFKRVTLRVLAVGVSKYLDSSKSLHFAHEDAKVLTEKLKKSGNGRPFQDVVVYPREGPLLNDSATKDNILDQLYALQKDAKEHDLALIFFSGHGEKFNEDHYYFLPYNYNRVHQPASTAVAWDIMKQYLEKIKCRTVIIVDTCHSGAISGMKGDPTNDLTNAVERALENFAQAKRGIILLAACLGGQQAAEHPEWGHGALTLAILECLAGEQVAPKATKDGLDDLPQRKSNAKPGVITLADVEIYARCRVPKLVGNRNSQAVIIKKLKEADIAPEQIPLAIYEAKKGSRLSEK